MPNMNKYEVFFRLLGMTIGIPLLRKICNSVPTVDTWGGFWCGSAGECHIMSSGKANQPCYSSGGFRHVGVSENSVPLNPMVNNHYPY